jgi:hypothetical protein
MTLGIPKPSRTSNCDSHLFLLLDEPIHRVQDLLGGHVLNLFRMILVLTLAPNVPCWEERLDISVLSLRLKP